MNQYKLHIRFVNGNEEVLELTNPHRLIPDNVRPHALVYTDVENFVHNIPFSSILDFWFKIEEFNACERSQETGVIKLPTPNCDCESCKATIEKIKTISNSR